MLLSLLLALGNMDELSKMNGVEIYFAIQALICILVIIIAPAVLAWAFVGIRGVMYWLLFLLLLFVVLYYREQSLFG